jgi:DNA polymerase-1
MNKLLYIIDTYALVFQVFHAIPSMTGPKGQPTNAIFGITRDLLTILKNKQPTHLLAAMESVGPGVRNEIYADYKANRSEMPDDLRPQIPGILQIFAGFRIPVVEHAGWEADDVIATIASRAAESGFDVRIVTNDKDTRQLIGPRIKLYNVRKDLVFDEQDLLREWGVRPDQVVDFQSLVGDSVDNVPGVPLIGPKKAGALLAQYGTLEGVLAHADEAPGAKLRENLKTFAEQARVSRRLVELQTDLPLEFDLETAAVRGPDRQKLLGLFTEFGFRRFGDELPPSDEEPSPPAAAQTRLSHVIDDREKLDALLAELRAQKKFCFDIATQGAHALQSELVGWALCWRTNDAHYVPVQGPPGTRTLDGRLVLAALKPILEDPQIEKISQDIKHEMLVLGRLGIHLQGIGVDPMVGDYLLEAGGRSHDLHSLAKNYLQHELRPTSDLVGSGKQQKLMFEVDVEKVTAHAAEDVDIAWQVGERIAEKLKQEKLWDLYWDLERPLIAVLADMELHGIRVDVEELQRQSRALDGRLAQLMQEIYSLAGHEFNIGSPKQLSEVLSSELGLPVVKRTKTGPSTDQEVLEKLALHHELPAKIIEHRQIAKLKGTYLDALPLLVNPETGRIHANFNQVVAATGRLSASDPNLQNIPIRTEEGRRTRKAFVPSSDGLSLVCADYSQIELRMLAHFSGDDALRLAFEEGIDIHQAVAAEIFGVAPEDVQSDMRRVAKAVNFGVIYGQSPYGLSEALQISRQDAARFIDRYFTRYSGVERYLHQILEECARSGYAYTILGRRRAITGIRSTTGRQRNLPERTAINSVIQGSAADLIKRAMINIYTRLRNESHPAQMLLQIHDELVFETPDAEIDSLLEIVKHEMEHAMDLDVPLVVDLAVGKNWLEVEAVSRP